MSNNKPLEKIIELIDEGNNIFITGGGGVGKSYILGKLKEHYGDNLDITSTTGISAINVKGQTIHSWAGIGIANKDIDEVVRKIRKKKSLENNIKNCKILAIDEISMMSDRILKYLDAVLKKIRGNRDVFGGLQVILIGDFFQLPPVKKDNPTDDYCFNSAVWARFNLYKIYLKEIKRQTDTKYIEALNKIRVGGSIPPNVIKLFKDREVASKDELDKNILQIFPLKENTKKYNDDRLAELTTKSYPYPAKDTFYRYDIETNKCTETININDDFDLLDRSEKLAVNSFNDRHCNAPKILTLKEGCRVMLLRNLDISKKLVNGTCGTVTKLTDNSIYVLFDNKSSAQKIEKETFEYIKEGKTIIRRHQYPLTLAYAINNHKSQGMTFDELVVNFEGTFEDGMAYVILSRTRTLEGLHLIGFKPELIHANDDVKDFYKNLEKDPKCIIFGEENEPRNITEKEESNNETTCNEQHDKDENDKNFDKEIMDDVVNRMKLDLKEDISSELKDEIRKIVKETVLEALSQHRQKENQNIVENNQEEVEEDEQVEDIFEDEEDIETVDDAEENDDENYFVKAFIKYKDEEYDEAFDLFIKHIEENPDDDKAYNYLGRICEIEEDYESAIKVYTDAIELNNNSTMHINNRANAYYEIKEYEKAIDDWNNILMVDSKYEINYFRKAYAEYKTENYDQSINDYTIYLENNPDDAVAYNNRGLSKEYSDNYSYEDAIKDYTQAIKLEPNNVRLNNRANAYYEIEEYKKAKADYLKVLEYDIDEETRQEINEKLKIINIIYNSKKQVIEETEDLFLENPILKLGPEETREVLEYEYKRGNYKKVIDICQEIEYGFGDEDYVIEDLIVSDLLAKSYYEDKQYDEAIRYWNNVLSFEEDYEIDYLSKGSAELQVENYDQAIKDFTTYLGIYPDSPDSACAYYGIGLAKECADNYSLKDAIKNYTDAIKLDKKNTMYINERANVYYEIKDYKKAVKDWEKVLKIDPEYEIDYFDKGYADHELENYDQAIKDYTIYLESHHENASAYNNRGWAKECSDNYDYKDAIEDYNIAIRLEPDNAKYLNNRARAYYWNDEYEKAVDDWEKVLELDSEYKINYYWKAYSENKIGSFENALLSIEKELSINPNDEDALNFKNIINDNLSQNDNEKLISEYIKNAELYYDNKEYKKAIDEWNKALEIDPEYEIDYFKKGYAEHEIENYDQAIKDYTVYLESNPDNAAAYNNRGVAKKCSDNYSFEDAIEDYSTAIRLEPNKTMYLNNRAEAFYEIKEYKKAVRDWNKILEIDSEYEIDHFKKGFAEDETGNNDQAIKDYTKHLEDNPDSINAYYNRGLCNFKVQDYKYAIEDFTVYINNEPNDISAHNNRAEAYYEIKEYKKAKDDYSTVINLDSKCAKAYNGLGLVYHELEEYTNAIENYNKAIKLNPTNVMYFLNRANSYYILEDDKKAKSDYLKVLEMGIDESIGKEIKDILNGIEQAFSNSESKKENVLPPPNIEKKLAEARRKIDERNYADAYDASKICNEILENDPQNIEALFLLGNTYFQRGYLDDAKESWEKVVELDKNHGKAWLNLGVIMEKSGRPDKALEYYKKAKQLDNSIKDLAENNIKNL